MSVQNIIDPLTDKINPKYIPAVPVTTPNLSAVLTAGNSSGGQTIDANGGSVLCDHLKCSSIEPTAFPFTPGIAVGGNLNMIPSTKLIFDGNISLQNNFLGGGNTDVIIDSIPVAGVALPNVVSYDISNKKLYYQPAGGGGASNLSAVLTAGNSAGTNDINMNNNDITNVASVEFTPTSKIDYASVNTKITVLSDNISLDAGGGGLIEMTSLGQTNITGTDVGINATAGSVSIQATGPTNMVDIERIRFQNNSITTTNVEPLNIGCQNNQNMNLTTTGTGDLSINVGRALNAIAQQATITATGSLFLSSTGTGGTARIQNSVGGNTRFDITTTGNELRNPSASGSTTIINSSADPALILRTNSGTNQTVLLDMFMSRNTGALPANGDIITEIRFKGDDYLGNEQEYAKIQTVATNVGSAGAPTNVDGTLSFQCITNDVYNTYMTLNGSTQQINMGKDVLMGGNNITGINKIGTTQGGATTGLSGQSLISGGAFGASWSYKMTGTYVGVNTTIGVTDTVFTDILGNPPISLVQGSFVLSPINKYKITVCGNAIGVNDIMEMYISCGNGANVYGGATFGTNPYYVNNMNHAGSYYTSYTITDIVDMSSSPFTIGGTANIYLYARCVTGSHTISTNAYNCSIEPVYV
jgi:hypothetical protein